MTLQKLLCHIFYVTTLSFSDITLIVISSTSKMVGDVTYILFTAWVTAQQANQTFIVAIKTIVYFIRFVVSDEASTFLGNTYALTNLTPRTTIPSAPYLSFNRIELRSHYIIFYFSRTSVRYDRRRWENLLNFSITV